MFGAKRVILPSTWTPFSDICLCKLDYDISNSDKRAGVCLHRQYQIETDRCDTCLTETYGQTSNQFTILINNNVNMGILIVKYDE